MHPYGQLRLSAETERSIVVLDFDLNKEEWALDPIFLNIMKEKIETLAKNDDFTLVSSPSGGYHAYFSSSTLASDKNQLARVLNCGFKEVDILTHGISAPSSYERKIINLSNN